MTIAWAVYDNRFDDVIGVWNTLEDAEKFLFENVDASDLWCIFPWEECLQEATA